MPSNITKATVKTTPLLFHTFSGSASTKLRGEHTLFDNPGALRVTCTAAVAPGLNYRMVGFQKGAAGDTIYLSYFHNEISSVRLTNPPPAGVTMLTTDQLSGCMFFVDQVAGSNDVVVSHSNAKQHSPPSNHGGVFPRAESVAASTLLTTLHTNAVADWAGAPYNVVLNPASSVNKPTYNVGADSIVRRKEAQGRLRLTQPHEAADPQRLNSPEYVGGTCVFGFYIGNQWRFYYQTRGAVEYRRPKTAPKGWAHGRDVHASGYALLGYGRIYPNPSNTVLV